MRFANQPTVATHQWGVSYALSDKQELIQMCLTSFLVSDFYEKQKEKIEQVQNLVARINDPEWCLKLAVFSRDYWLRSINHVVFIEACKQLYWKRWSRDIIKKYLVEMTRRPDELMDMVGYYAQRNNMPFDRIVLPNALKLAVRAMVEQFKDYSLAKYKGEWHDVNIYDLVSMVHATSDSIKKLMRWVLPAPETWEVEISKNWNNKETWWKLLAWNKLGSLATIRNIRNMLDAQIDPVYIINYLDTHTVWSDIFPFQALQALDQISTNTHFDWKIEKTMLWHVRKTFNSIAQKYKGKTVIWVDVSGSMHTSVSGMSKINRLSLALMYWMMLKDATEWDLYLWSDKCMKIETDDYRTVLISAGNISWWTYVQSFLSEIKDKGYDNVIILTDGQIADALTNVANDHTVVWQLADYKNTIAKWSKMVQFSWYNDIMWRIWADLFHLDKLEAEISLIKSM